MSAPQLQAVELTITATADAQTLPLSATDLYAEYVNTFGNVITAAGTIKVGLTNVPVCPPSFFPPIPPLVPNVGYKRYYNLKTMFVTFSKATDSLVVMAVLPPVQPNYQ